MIATQAFASSASRIDGPAAIDVAVIPFAVLQAQRDSALAALGAQERARFVGFAHEADGDRFALGRWLLRLMLAHREIYGAAGPGFSFPDNSHVRARASGIGFTERPGLAPVQSGLVTTAPGARLRFSLARSQDQAIVAIGTTQALGVDIEDLRRAALFDEAVSDAYFDHAETEFLDRTPNDRRLCLLNGWTAKEAIAKAAGAGLRLPFQEIIVRNDVVHALPAGLPDPLECNLRRIANDASSACVAWW